MAEELIDPSAPVAERWIGVAEPSAGHERVLRVVLVEDDTSIRFILSQCLADEGFEVTALTDGQAAIEWLAAGAVAIDAFVIDLMMPRLNGQELARWIRGEPRFARLPIVMMTGAPAGILDVCDTGAAPVWIRKPFDLDVMVETLRSLCVAGGGRPREVNP